MRKMFLTLLLMLLFVAGCGGGQEPQNVGDSKYAKKIVVGLDDEYAPMGFRDEKDNIVGFDVDLAKEVARRMNVEFEFLPIDWNNKENELESGRIDIIWNGLDITPERKERILYSKPYMDNRQILLVKKDNHQGIRSEDDLAGKSVGTQNGSNSADYVNQNVALKNSFAEFKTYRSFKDAFRELEDGLVDVLIVDELAGRYEMSKVPSKFDPIEVTIGPVTELGIGFRKEDTELRDKIQKVFDGMIADGTARKISEHWFQADLIKARR